MSASQIPAESLSQRELRNESGRVLRAVSQGQSFVLTNNGTPVGKIVPLDAAAPALRIGRPVKRHGGWASLRIERKGTEHSVAELIDDLREERA